MSFRTFRSCFGSVCRCFRVSRVSLFSLLFPSHFALLSSIILLIRLDQFANLVGSLSLLDTFYAFRLKVVDKLR